MSLSTDTKDKQSFGLMLILMYEFDGHVVIVVLIIVQIHSYILSQYLASVTQVKLPILLHMSDTFLQN